MRSRKQRSWPKRVYKTSTAACMALFSSMLVPALQQLAQGNSDGLIVTVMIMMIISVMIMTVVTVITVLPQGSCNQMQGERMLH